MAVNWKNGIDLPEWKSLTTLQSSSGAGVGVAYDMRNNAHRHPNQNILVSNSQTILYNPLMDEAANVFSPSLSGSFGAGATSVFHPGQSPKGTLGFGTTSTMLILNEGICMEGVKTIASCTRTTTTATIPYTNHTWIVGQIVLITNSSDPTSIPNGTYAIASISAGVSFTITVPNAGLTSGITVTVGLSVAITANSQTLSMTAGTRSTTTATFTNAGHSLRVNDSVYCSVSNDSAAIPIGCYRVASVVDANTITINVPNAGGTSALTCTLAKYEHLPTNQLANRGDGVGFYIRVTDNGSGGSGKIEYKKIVSSECDIRPRIILDSALSFTPVQGSQWDLCSGRIYYLSAGTLAAGIFKYYDVAMNVMNGNGHSTTNLPATIGTDSNMIALADNYVPYNRVVGEGFIGTSTTALSLKCLTASASGASSLTVGSGGDANMIVDEYKNFTVRIVEDTATPTAVGQVRKISTMTAGATSVITLSTAFTVTPSTTCKFVIENNNNQLLLVSTGTTATYTYHIDAIMGETANTWDTSSIPARASSHTVGSVFEQSFGIVPDTLRLSRHSYIYLFTSGNALHIYDYATGKWMNGVSFMGASYTNFISTGTCAAYDPICNQGRFLYMNCLGTQRFIVFDMMNRTIIPYAYFRNTVGTAVVGQKLFLTVFYDGTTPITHMNWTVTNTTSLFNAPCLGVM